ncbi:dimethyl sulfoxide reductase anchor subunit family protein [Vibrio olivae]
MHELPLVFFTVLAQASAGLFILMTLNKLIIKQPDDKAMFVSGVISLVIVGVAGFSAILHLGQPFRAINALFGTGRSPMSNEIVSCSIYGGLLFAHLAVSYLRPQMTNAIKASRIATAIAGIALLVLIPKVYTIETIPQWNTSYTMIQMLLAAFTAGGALAMICSQIVSTSP